MGMEGQTWTSLCADQGSLCAEGAERHTGNILGGGGVLMTLWLLISVRLNSMQSMMEAVFSATQLCMVF